MSEPLTAETRALLTLHLIPGLGPRLTAALLQRFDSAEAVLQTPANQLRQVAYIGDQLATDIANALSNVAIDAELDKMARQDVRLLVLGTPDYPAPLATIPDPPHLLYVKGTIQPEDTGAVAVVGSRHGTAYGRRVAERLGGGLARAGITVVSGLARGIDAVAHRAALDAGGRTLAVLAGGLSKVYPPEHVELAHDVAAKGALLSEAYMDQEPMAGLFPVRNRLISGLCRGVVVVEAAAQSGTLTTAHHALEQGREVFAVPGPVDSPASAGTLHLLREGARLVRDVGDILVDLQGIAPLTEKTDSQPGDQAKPAVAPPPGLDDKQLRVWELLSDRPHHVDELARALEMPVGQLNGMLMLLEMKRVLRRLPGNLYERC